MPARRPNSWFSSSKTKASSSGHRSSMTLGQAMSAARKAGHASGDTGMFDSWLRSKGLASRGNVVVSRLRQEYNRGFEQKFAGASKREQERAAETRKREDAKRLADRKRADELNAAHIRKLDKEEADLRKKREKEEKHAKSVTSRFGSYKGYGIFKTGDGAYHYSGEKESAFDSLKDVKRFVDSLRKNPKKNRDVIDDAAATGMQIYGDIFAIPSAVLDKTISTALQAKDAVKRRLNPGWYDQESDGDARASLMFAASTARGAEELARIHKWAVGKRDRELQEVVEARATQFRIPMSQIKGSYPRGWNPEITDRALRYRANATPPEGPKQCAMCGSKTTVEVGHIDGYEENSEAANLMWTCRSCNVLCANAMREAGLGRLTHQYNPAGGATNIGEWMQAVGAITRKTGKKYSGKNYGLVSEMKVSDAVAMIRATSPSKRSEFASQIRRHNPRAKKNSEAGASQFFQKFHGADSQEEVIVENEIHFHENLGVIGVLITCVIDTPSGVRATIEFDSNDGDQVPFLCASEDGCQLYIEGGNQEIDLKALKMDGKNWYKERMVLGQFSPPESGRKWNLGYQTAKSFDQFEEILYQHDLGEPNEGEPKSHRRVAPLLEYEPLNKLLYISGGEYLIKLPLIGVSPGIEN